MGADEMRIGIDISVLQTPHRMRGIGYTAINFINHLPKEAKKRYEFVLHHYPIASDEKSPLDLLQLRGVTYTTQEIQPYKHVNLGLPGKFNIVSGVINKALNWKRLRFGDTRVHDFSDIDRFLQFDQNQPVPSRRKVHTTVVLHDVIPYVMEQDYLWSYRTARTHGSTRLGALRKQLERNRYIRNLRTITKRASGLIANSERTKQDFIRYVGTPADKISVCHLGVSQQSGKISKSPRSPAFKRYIETSWGPMPKNAKLKPKEYLLFIGGADPRRKIHELVAAFNNLRARGYDIKLVLAGDTMKGPAHIPNKDLQMYLQNTSYLDDIYFMGFVTDEQRDWLYKNALAFVYPSVYEGFGLPVVEAMHYGVPVITYDNTSIREVAQDAVLYATDYHSIMRSVIQLIKEPGTYTEYANRGTRQAATFSWGKTAESILSEIT
jgi:glycosyltransferase involved in cell wall biosynthesis